MNPAVLPCKEISCRYSIAWDSKHKVMLEEGKSARTLFEIR